MVAIKYAAQDHHAVIVARSSVMYLTYLKQTQQAMIQSSARRNVKDQDHVGMHVIHNASSVNRNIKNVMLRLLR